MANGYKIVEGLPELIDKLKSSPVQVAQRVGYEIKDALTKVNAEQVALAPTDRGPLRQHITWRHVGPLQYVVICPVPYAAYVEFGTRKRFKAITGIDSSPYRGKRGGGSGQGFYESILAWVRRKGFAAAKTKSGRPSKSAKSRQAEESAAYAIYLSILRHGSHPHPFFFGPLLRMRVDLKRNIEKAIRKF